VRDPALLVVKVVDGLAHLMLPLGAVRILVRAEIDIAAAIRELLPDRWVDLVGKVRVTASEVPGQEVPEHCECRRLNAHARHNCHPGRVKVGAAPGLPDTRPV
jgi:hypothetical protein